MAQTNIFGLGLGENRRKIFKVGIKGKHPWAKTVEEYPHRYKNRRKISFMFNKP